MSTRMWHDRVNNITIKTTKYIGQIRVFTRHACNKNTVSCQLMYTVLQRSAGLADGRLSNPLRLAQLIYELMRCRSDALLKPHGTTTGIFREITYRPDSTNKVESVTFKLAVYVFFMYTYNELALHGLLATSEAFPVYSSKQ